MKLWILKTLTITNNHTVHLYHIISLSSTKLTLLSEFLTLTLHFNILQLILHVRYYREVCLLLDAKEKNILRDLISEEVPL